MDASCMQWIREHAPELEQAAMAWLADRRCVVDAAQCAMYRVGITDPEQVQAFVSGVCLMEARSREKLLQGLTLALVHARRACEAVASPSQLQRVAEKAQLLEQIMKLVTEASGSRQ